MNGPKIEESKNLRGPKTKGVRYGLIKNSKVLQTSDCEGVYVTFFTTKFQSEVLNEIPGRLLSTYTSKNFAGCGRLPGYVSIMCQRVCVFVCVSVCACKCLGVCQCVCQ